MNKVMLGGKSVRKKERYELLIPCSIFTGTSLTTFEALVIYHKDVRGLNFRQISDALDRDERNIWTVYNRAKKKVVK